tara:strand:- start:688 stop:1761 length:1074 start_codon:yes stop_codon:yes gene_type:complete
MFIVSPKWIFLENKKIEKDKSLLIEGSVIKDILDTKSVKKYHNEIKKIEYPNHIMMPTFIESYIDMDDCLDQTDFDKKMKMLLENGVTRLQVVSHSFERILSYKVDSNIDISYVISFDGKYCNKSMIKDMINILDFYKADPTKQFSLNLINILDFEKEIIEKLASISNEINMNIHIQGIDLSQIEDKQIINQIIDFWESINLLNNCFIHDLFCKNENWISCMNKKNIKLMIDFNTIDSIDKLKSLSSLLKKKYICILINNKNNAYGLYKVLKLIDILRIKNLDDLENLIINCVTVNAFDVFHKSNYSSLIKKGSLASFNIFDYSINNFFIKDDSHKIYNLDNQSLSNVWSAGKQIIF